MLFRSTVTALNAKPAGLVAGTNYFYDANYGGEPGAPRYNAADTHTAGASSGPVARWQGVTFTNITYPGTCTFTYIPIASPTQDWDPNGGISNGLPSPRNGALAGVAGSSFVLTIGMTIAKTSPTTSISTVGQVVNYSYAVKNTGGMVLTAPLTVTDNKTTVTCPEIGRAHV